jgi:hypothetical protein
MTEPQEKPKEKWFLKTRSVVIALLAFGPFALPLLWLHPRYRLRAKIFWTTVVLVVTVILLRATAASVESLKSACDQIFTPGGPYE